MDRTRRSDEERQVPEERASSKAAQPSRERLPAQDGPLGPQDVLALQPHAGNAALARMLSRQPEAQAPPGARPAGAGSDVQRDLGRRFLEMGLDAFMRAYPNLVTAAGMLFSPAGPDHSMALKAQATGDVALAKAMFDQATHMRGAIGLGIGAFQAADADRRIDQMLMELNLMSFPMLLGMLGSSGPGSGAPLMGVVQRTFQVVMDLRTQMIIAGLPVPPPAAPPGPAGPRAE
jgi:hypothetical protein